MAPFKVIIVGGGLAGSCLANGLVNNSTTVHEIAVSLYERDLQNEQRGGYMIRLGSHALAGFRACLTPTQFQSLMGKFGRSGGVIASAPTIFDKKFKVLIDLSKFPAYTKSAPISRALLRDELQAPLREKGIIKYGMRFKRFEILDNSIRAHFADGSFEDGDILIAADGNNSAANKQVGCKNIREVVESIGYLGKCDIQRGALANLPSQLVEKGAVGCMSKELTLFSSLYLPDNLRLTEGLKPEDLKNTKFMFDKFDEELSSLMAAASWKKESGVSYPSSGEEAKKAILERLRVAQVHRGYLEIWETVDSDAIYQVTTRVADMTPNNWRQKAKSKSAHQSECDVGHPRVWLVGDAIHPMLPTRGMGANQAIHDTADALASLTRLAEHKKRRPLTDADVEKELAVYENLMIPRAFKWVKASNDAASLGDVFDGLKGTIIAFAISILLSVIGGMTSIARALGWKPKDDAPELP